MSSPDVYFRVKPNTVAAARVEDWIALIAQWTESMTAFIKKHKLPADSKTFTMNTHVAGIQPPYKTVRAEPPIGFRYKARERLLVPHLKVPEGKLVRDEMMAIVVPSGERVALLFFGLPLDKAIFDGLSLIRGAGITHSPDKKDWIITTNAALTKEYPPVKGLVEVTGSVVEKLIGKNGI